MMAGVNMKKKYILILLMLNLSLCFNCKHKVKLIPEITPYISEENIYDLKSKETVGKIIKSDARLIFITLKGEIFRLDTEKQILDFLYNFNINIEPQIFDQNSLVVLKQQDADNYVIFNLTEMQIEKELKNIKLDQIIGLHRELLIYLHNNELIFFAYPNDKIQKKVELTANTQLFNSEFVGDSVLVLSSRHLYSYHRVRNSLEILEMKYPPASEFLLDRGYIYYGSANRELVKFSLKPRRARWKFKLPVLLKLRPQKAGPYVAIAPEDNNIYFFTPRGTLRWWSALDAPRALPPVIMSKNAAVFLMNREFRKMNNKIRFLNYKDKEVISYQFKYQLESNPVYLNNYLYILCEDKERGVKTISRIGNKHDIGIEISPQHVKPVGKSLRFLLKPINLVDPLINIKILDKSGNSVFEKQFVEDEQPAFIWIPDKVGDYRLVLAADAKNHQNLKVETSFKVLDVDTLMKKYYFKLQKECSDNRFPQEIEGKGKGESEKVKKSKSEKAKKLESEELEN